MPETKIEMIQPMLGLDPFVLVEMLFKPGDEDATLRIRHGGAVDTADEIASTLAAALLAVIGKGGAGAEWSDVARAIREMPDEEGEQS